LCVCFAVTEGSRSFLKKRTKKLLIMTGKRCRAARTNKQKFLLLFSKRSAFLLRTGQAQRRMHGFKTDQAPSPNILSM
jgi:hypothetical protein